MPLRIPATVTGLEASIRAQAKKAGNAMKIDMGAGSKSINSLSQPLGRITGKADQFTKSMEAANARVLAFGASVGVLSAVTRGFKELVNTTIEVEKRLASINAILGGTGAQLDQFKKTIFEVARNTEQSFDTVSQAALELSRQGLKAEEVTKRLGDAMILTRLSGQGAAEAVAGLTAAVNSFKKSGITSAEVVNKFSDAAKNAAVSERDLAEAVKRAGSVAQIAGVSFDELIGIVSAVQQKTSRGGAVIGNSFKTIFTRIQSLDKLQTMQKLGVQVTDTSGDVLNATQLIKNLATTIEDLPDARRLQIAENLVGKFQVAPFVAILEDYNDQASIAVRLTDVSQNAATAAYERNAALNKTLSAAINEATVNLKELANTLGEIGVTDSLKNILSFFNSLVGNIKELMEGEGIGSDFARGIVKGIGNIISGPGLAIFGAVIAKLTLDLARFGVGSLQTFFGLNKAAKEQSALQGQIASTLMNSKSIQKQILAIENSSLTTEQKRAAQTKFFTIALNEQLRIMTQMQAISARVAPGVARGIGGKRGRAAGGFIPNFNIAQSYGNEQADIARGVGGAPKSARPVTMPNFNFGGGQRGTMVANTSEFVVPDFAGGGSAIFNQNMVSSMGLPAGAKKVGAAGGYIPNFAGPTAILRNLGITTQAQFNAAVKAQGGTGTTLKTAEGNVSPAQAKNTFKRGAGQKGMLTISQGYRYGVAALFPSKKTSDTAATFAGESENEGILGLRQRGFTGMTLKGVQISDLQTMQRKKRRGMKESENRKKLGRLFAEPLLRYGSELIGETFSNDEARQIRGKIKSTGGRGREGSKLFSTAVEGGIFESAISLVTKGAGAIPEFKSHNTEREPFDFEEGGRADNKFKKAFGFRNDLVRADAKRTSSNSAVQSLIFKALNDRAERTYIFQRATAQQKAGKGLKPLKLAAGGYIPNFAGPLEDAIARESATGVPINQVRVNQAPKLRNAGNPMGLAVTNMRDEPTGRVPNFAKGGAGGSGGGIGGATSDLLTKFIVLQMVVSGLSGIVSETSSNAETFNKALKAMNLAMTAMFAASAFGGVGKTFSSAGRLLTGKTGADLAARGRRMTDLGRVKLSRPSTSMLPPAKGVGMVAGGAARTLAGSFLSVAGPVAAVGIAAYSLSKAFDYSSGRSNLAALNTEALATSTRIAEKELAALKVPESFKALMRQDAKAMDRDVQGYTEMRRAGMGLFKPFGDFKGSMDKEFKADIGGMSAAAITEGISRREIYTRLGKMNQERLERGDIAKFDPKEEVQAFFEGLETLMMKFNAQTTISTVANALPPALLKELTETSRLEAEGISSGLGMKPEDKRRRSAANRQLREFAVGAGIEGADVISSSLLAKGVRTAVKTGDTPAQRQERIRADMAKIRLTTEIDIAKIKAKAISKDQIALQNARALGEASKLQLLDLEKRVELDEGRTKRESSIVDIQKTQISNLESLNFGVEEEKALKELIMSKDLEQLASSEDRRAVLSNIIDLDKKGAKEAALILQRFEEQVRSIKKKGEAQDENLEKDYEAKRVSLEIARAEERRLRTLKREARIRADLRDALLERSEIGTAAARGSIERNVNLTSRERARALFDILPQAQADQRQGFENRSLKEINDLLNSIDANKSGLKRFTDDLREILSDPELGKQGLGAVLTKLEKLTGIERGLFPESILLEGGYDKRNTAMKDIIDLFNRLGISLENFGLKLDAEADAIKDGLGKFAKAPEILAETVQGLAESTQRLRANAALATTAGEFISGARGIRENVHRGRVDGRDLAGQFSITREFALQGLRDTARTGITKAERNQAGRELGFVNQQFDLQEQLIELYKNEKDNLEEIKRVEDEILDIDRKRKMVNQSIAALLEDTFIKSAEDIEREFGRNMVASAEQFKKTITDGMVDAIVLGQDLGDILRSAATDFFTQAAKHNMAAAFDSLLSGIGGGGKKKDSGGGNVLSFLGGIFGYQTGGLVRGGSGTRDDVPTLLTGGEFVVQRDAVSQYGVGFLEGLNRGNVGQMQRGGLFTPGTYGQGAISGKGNLLDFATQSFTSGQFDQIRGGTGFGSVSLEPQSVRLTHFGRGQKRSQDEQQSKEKAFGLYVQQTQYEERLKEQEREQKKAFWNSMLAAVGTAAFSGLVNKATTGNFAGMKGNPNQKGVLSALSVDPSEIDPSRTGGGFWSGLASIFSPRGGSGTQANNLVPRGRQAGSPSRGVPSVAGRGSRTGGSPPLPQYIMSDELTNSVMSFVREGNFAPFRMDGRVFHENSQKVVRDGGNGQVLPSRLEVERQMNIVPIARQGRAAGGYISPTAGVDTVPSMLSGGEFVMNAAATQNIGAGNLAALNSGGGGNGGDDAIVAAINNLGDELGGSGETIINITVNSDGTENQDSQGGQEDQQNLATKIKDVVRATIDEEKRLGGSLRRV
jgi:TP901 family phage tail tape measure protein